MCNNVNRYESDGIKMLGLEQLKCFYILLKVLTMASGPHNN